MKQLQTVKPDGNNAYEGTLSKVESVAVKKYLEKC
jgi:hypothetical protein